MDVATNMAEVVPNIEEQAFETPTYDDAFPSLPVAAREGPSPQGPWQPKFVRTSTCTQVFTVPMEERRYKEVERQFGEERKQADTCKDIMQKTGVSIEMNVGKDGSLTVVVHGKQDAVMRARRELISRLQTQASAEIRIPREHHGVILGAKGKKLQDLELATSTKITIPRQNAEIGDIITIVGSKEGIDRARHEIQCISDEQAKLAFERIQVPKIYHPFICGPHNSAVKGLMEKTGAKINVPPPSVHKDEIVVSGEKEGVMQAKAVILAILDEKERKCQTVSVEVRKSQHKYVVGPKGTNIHDILAATGVSVEMPPLDSSSETITLRGEQDKLGPALTLVYSKANSVVFQEVVAPAWLHRFIIGRKGANIRQITEDYPKVHIEFTEGQDKIQVEGPPEEVEKAVQALETIVADLQKRMAVDEVRIDTQFHKHIIGKNGVNVKKIKERTGVSIKIPGDGENNPIIRIEGEPAGVAAAKQELEELANRMENEKSRDIIIDQRFHKTIIGAKGERIREIRDKFKNVQITFPEPGKKSDIVMLRGPKNDVDKCYKHMTQVHHDLVESNHQAQVHIFKGFHKNIIGKGGANIRKIRDETGTRIDLPSENADSDVITITGRKEAVEKAQQMIEDIQKNLANIKEVVVEIPYNLHNSIIGAKGRLIRAIAEECGGIIIRFPPEGSNSNKVTLRGPKDDVENARKQLLALTSEKEKSSFTAEIHAKPQYHKFLIGRGGSNIRKVRESTGARIIFPTSQDSEEPITVVGTKEAVEKAKKELEELIRNLDNIVESDMTVDPKHHRYFVARRGEVLRQIADEFGGVTVSFPRSGVKSDRVVIKGPKDCVEAAKKKIQEIAADLDAQVQVQCIIPQKFHRTVMGAGGYNVKDITKNFEVGIKFPDKPVANGANKQPAAGGDVAVEEEGALPNGDASSEDGADKGPKKNDIIVITGKPENCQKAQEALLALVPVTKEVQVPFDHHRFIIGQKGQDVRAMMQEYDVNINVPPADANSETIRVTGPPANVDRAVRALEAKSEQLDKEKEDRALRSFQLTFEVDPKHHPKIIGRKGAVISKIRIEHQVYIQFPEKESEHQNIITITGYEANANGAKEAILKIVRELEDMEVREVIIDHRVHPRIIGGKGRILRAIMQDFKVDIRFPRQDDPNPDAVQVMGDLENVEECVDHLLNMAEEFMQDVREQEDLQQYTSPPSRGAEQEAGRPGSQDSGFVVKNAPWDRIPDTASELDFPNIGGGAAPVVAPRPTQVWGPSRRK